MPPSIGTMVFARQTEALRLAKKALAKGVTCRRSIFNHRYESDWPIRQASEDRADRNKVAKRLLSYSRWLDDKNEDELFVFFYCHCKYFISYLK